MKPAKPGTKRPARSGIKNEQLVAERVVADMMAKDAFSQWLGITVVDVRPRTATVRATVRPEMQNGFGVAHGGIVFSIADSAFAFACNTHGKVTVSIENSVTYPAAINVGDVLTAVAELEGESNKLGYYRVVVRNQKDDVVSVFRGTCFKTKNDHVGAKTAEPAAAGATAPVAATPTPHPKAK
ncbi:MAG: hotdog fold thioesterase [Gemmatimonadetes bacterium]|nr:hotdog fold thioesterase [Gemmatimonadota bacterium]